MNSLGVPHQLGAPVTLQWTDPQGEQHTDQFTLCGWWYSPTNFSEACAWVSAETATQLMPGYDSENAADITLGVTLYQPRELEQQAQQILQDQGLPQLQFTTNLSYNSARLDQAQQQALPFYSPAILVLVCGYLMIYSIVHVAASGTPSFFASLKSLGMTPRQVRRMLLEQGCAVTLLGLIPGWALDLGCTFASPAGSSPAWSKTPPSIFLSWQPFVVAALCTLLTALVAYLLPTWRLARMTPAQAVQSVSPASSVLAAARMAHHSTASSTAHPWPQRGPHGAVGSQSAAGGSAAQRAVDFLHQLQGGHLPAGHVPVGLQHRRRALPTSRCCATTKATAPSLRRWWRRCRTS